MKVVGSGFRDHVHHRTRIPAILSVEGVGNDAELFNAVRRRLDGRKIHELVVGISAVHAEVIGAGTATVHRYRTCVLRSVEQTAIAVSKLRLHARLQLQELIGVARVQRQLIYRAVVDDGSQLRAGRVNLGSLRRNFHNFL